MTTESTLASDAACSLPLGLSDTELLALITRDVGATVGVFNLQLRLIYCNDEYARWFGTEPSQVIGKTVGELYGEADGLRILPLVERVRAGERLEYQRLLTNPYGAEEWRTICLTPARNAQGAIAGFVASAIDVHELQVALSALRAANQRLSSHIDNSPLAVLEMDHELRLIHCSERAVQLMGWEHHASVEGRLLLELLNATDARLNQALQRLQSGQESQNREENAFVRRDGTEIHAEWFNSALTDATGRVTSIMTLVQDVSARVQMARQQYHRANHDALTGLDNRASFHERLERALAQTRPPADLLALLFIDLDGFKRINDQQGHQAGDEVLRIVAQRLLRTVREGDTVARLGGDEFLVMLDKDVTPLEPERIGQRIIEALSQPMIVDGQNLEIGASIGVAMHPPLPGQLEVLMNHADQAMYAAKRAGKGRLFHAESEGA